MFANISPLLDDLDETLSTLNFATRCRETSLNTQKNNKKKIQINSQKKSTSIATEVPPSEFRNRTRNYIKDSPYINKVNRSFEYI